MSDPKPQLILIAGPNGTGKTDFTNRVSSHEWLEGCEYINPDLIAQREFGDWNSPAAIDKAARHATHLRYQKSILNLTKALPSIQRGYVYDNSVDGVLPRLQFRTVEGSIQRVYAEDHAWSNQVRLKIVQHQRST